jgi:hypothetical protein
VALESSDHGPQPTGGHANIVVDEEDGIACRGGDAGVSSRIQSSRGLAQADCSRRGLPSRQSGHELGGGVRRSIVDHDHFVAIEGVVLVEQAGDGGEMAAVNRIALRATYVPVEAPAGTEPSRSGREVAHDKGLSVFVGRIGRRGMPEQRMVEAALTGAKLVGDDRVPQTRRFLRDVKKTGPLVTEKGAAKRT